MLTQADKDYIVEVIHNGIYTSEDISAIRSNTRELSGLYGQLSLGNTEIRTELRKLRDSAHQQAVLLEDLESRFTTVCEAIDESFETRSSISAHDIRLASLESFQNLMRRTIKEHSRRLNYYEH